MILEGIVTTIAPDGSLNIAPMGPIVDADMRRLILRPFKSAQTYRNLKEHGEGVFHVTDNVLLLAQAAVGEVNPVPEVERATYILGYILSECARFHEFRTTKIDDAQDRTTIEAEVVHSGSRGDLLGFNRAKHAVLEAAILATRTMLIPREEIDAEFRKLKVIVEKTGGPQEHAAFRHLEDYVHQAQAQGRA
ncbi:MAG: DUF447 family protein [Gemmataceae bacterium]|nr:DUF447 family protein [Gemmataceae bacterium]